MHIWCIITFRSRFSHDASKLECLMHYCLGKQVFSWRAKKCKFVALLRVKAGFLMMQPKTKCIFDALLRFVAGFLVTRQKRLNFMYYYVEKQVCLWRAKKGANLLQDYLKKQVFSWRAKISYIWCINTWQRRFFHDTTENKENFWRIITFRSRFSHDTPKLLYLMH